MAYVQHALIQFQLGDVSKGVLLLEKMAAQFNTVPDALNCYAQARHCTSTQHTECSADSD